MSKFLSRYSGFIGLGLFIMIMFLVIFNIVNIQAKIEKDFMEYSDKITIIENIDIGKKQKIIDFIKQDLSIIFANQNFIKLCSDVDYLINTKLLEENSINYEISISDNLKKNKNYPLKAIKSTLSRIDTIIKISSEFEQKYYQSLGKFYVIPNSSQCIFSGYTVNTSSQTIHFITNKNRTKILNEKNKFITIELDNRKMFFEKEKLFKHYNELFSNIYSINDLLGFNIKNKLKDFIINFYISYASYFILIVFIVATIASFAVVWFLGKNNLYAEMKNKEEELNKREEDISEKEAKVNRLEHTLSHDVKTNLTQNLIELGFLYKQVDLAPDLKNHVLSIYARDLMVKYSNDVGKTPLNIYKFPSDFYDETFIKFFNTESSDIEKDIFEEFFILKKYDNLNDINKYSISTNSKNLNEAFFENEISSILFKLLNNALKYAKLSEKIIVELFVNNDIICSITNTIINEEDLETVEFNINTAIESKEDYRNLFLSKSVLNKYRFSLKVKTNKDLNQITIDVMRA